MPRDRQLDRKWLDLEGVTHELLWIRRRNERNTYVHRVVLACTRETVPAWSVGDRTRDRFGPTTCLLCLGRDRGNDER